MRLSLVAAVLVCLTCVGFSQSPTSGSLALPPGATPPPRSVQELSHTLGDFLGPRPYPSSKLTGFYEEIPANLEPAVRFLAEDNFSSSTALLEKELDKTTDKRERARIMMWLGLAAGNDALNYDVKGGWYGIATTATMRLRDAIKLDPEVFKASEVARVLGEIMGAGWGDRPPDAEIEEHSKLGEKNRSFIDFFYAGIINQRLASRSWGMSDTAAADQASLGYFAKAVAINPNRYESWTMYFPALARLQMFDVITTDAEKMYNHFKALRAPLLSDQGPVAIYLKSRFDWTQAQAEQFIQKLAADHPEDPLAWFELARVAAPTSPSLGIERFKEFIAKVDSGAIKLEPREQGYRISALYKLGFLCMELNRPDEALKYFHAVKQINPRYAEVDLNIASAYGVMADRETTSPAKVQLLEKAMSAAGDQKKYDYAGKALTKADEARKKLNRTLRAVRNELEQTSGTAAAAVAETTQSR